MVTMGKKPNSRNLGMDSKNSKSEWGEGTAMDGVKANHEIFANSQRSKKKREKARKTHGGGRKKVIFGRGNAGKRLRRLKVWPGKLRDVPWVPTPISHQSRRGKGLTQKTGIVSTAEKKF